VKGSGGATRNQGKRRRMLVLRGLLGPDVQGARQSMAALAISSVTSIGAGVALASFTGTLERLPGLLVLVPAAIGMRGNIFGALGSRLSTTIHAGTFSLTTRRDTVVAQNVIAASVLTLVTAVVLGALTKIVAPLFGLVGLISVSDLVVVSGVGAVAASVLVLVVTLLLAQGSVRFGWDLDNVNAPIVSAVGDVVTLPALVGATWLVSRSVVTPVSAAVLGLLSAGALTWVARSRLLLVIDIVRESLPVLLGTGVLLIVAGVVIEHRLADFAEFRALMVLVPASLASAGAVGGILSGRLSSKLHLGVIEPALVPNLSARRDIQLTFVLSLPVFLTNALLAHAVSAAWGFNSPGFVRLVAVSMIGGMVATAFAAVIAYYGTSAAVRFGVDPDTYGMPLVTSTVDLVGAAALVFAISTVGLP
jgi:mgtE-like transporter